MYIENKLIHDILYIIHDSAHKREKINMAKTCKLMYDIHRIHLSTFTNSLKEAIEQSDIRSARWYIESNPYLERSELYSREKMYHVFSAINNDSIEMVKLLWNYKFTFPKLNVTISPYSEKMTALLNSIGVFTFHKSFTE
mgnify:CR=1 FL=1